MSRTGARAGAMPARGAAAADGAAAASGCSELGLARIRNARRLLAFPRSARQPQSESHVRAQRFGCELYPEACEAARDAGWDFMGHGFVQKPMHRVDDQKAAIADTIAAIKKVTGKPPRGWESPGLTETDETLDLWPRPASNMSPIGCSTSNLSASDAPWRHRFRSPSVEINDVVISAVQQQPSDEIFRRGRDQFDRLHLDGAKAPRVMAISIHPYLTGVPHRIKYLEMLYDRNDEAGTSPATTSREVDTECQKLGGVLTMISFAWPSPSLRYPCGCSDGSGGRNMKSPGFSRKCSSPTMNSTSPSRI